MKKILIFLAFLITLSSCTNRGQAALAAFKSGDKSTNNITVTDTADVPVDEPYRKGLINTHQGTMYRYVYWVQGEPFTVYYIPHN